MLLLGYLLDSNLLSLETPPMFSRGHWSPNWKEVEPLHGLLDSGTGQAKAYGNNAVPRTSRCARDLEAGTRPSMRACWCACSATCRDCRCRCGAGAHARRRRRHVAQQ